MLQNKITTKRFLEILEESRVTCGKEVSRLQKERAKSKLSFIMDILELYDLGCDYNKLNYQTLKRLNHKLVKEIFKYEELKNQMLRRYISYHTSGIANTIKDKDLVKFCEILSYTISKDYFKLL